MEKPIILKVRSQRFETDNVMPGGRHSGRRALPVTEWAGQDSDAAEEVELTTAGGLLHESGRVEVYYDESEISGLDGCRTRLIFDAANPESLTMMRSGDVRVTMVFSPGLRHICKYETPFMSFEMTLMTHIIENNLLAGGSLTLEYTTELAGVSRARTRLTVTFRESDVQTDEFDEEFK